MHSLVLVQLSQPERKIEDLSGIMTPPITGLQLAAFSKAQQRMVAEQLNSLTYMKCRAAREGVEYQFTSALYLRCMRRGIGFFFGVFVTSAGLYEDTQECHGFLDQFFAAKGADLATRQAARVALGW